MGHDTRGHFIGITLSDYMYRTSRGISLAASINLQLPCNRQRSQASLGSICPIPRTYKLYNATTWRQRTYGKELIVPGAQTLGAMEAMCGSTMSLMGRDTVYIIKGTSWLTTTNVCQCLYISAFISKYGLGILERVNYLGETSKFMVVTRTQKDIICQVSEDLYHIDAGPISSVHSLICSEIRHQVRPRTDCMAPQQ
jgi:hypothetical protein